MNSIEIQLVPDNLKDKNVLNRLRLTLSKAEALRGCVAFWVIQPEVLGMDFIRLLKNKQSFFCIDIHNPTDLDSIESHYNIGEKKLNLFLHLRKTTKAKANLHLPRHLLHAKIMLFDLPDNMAEIWVGSHNLTNRALFAGNVEASTVIKCSRDSDYYIQVKTYLNQIKKDCEAFDHDLMHVYRSIQNESARKDDSSENVFVIHMVGNNVDQLLHKTILLLGDGEFDIQSLGLGRVTQSVFIHAMDLSTFKEALYEATVRSSGEILEDDPMTSQMQFDDRLYAIRKDTYFPYQSERSKRVTSKDLENYSYWANIKIENKLEHFELKSNLKKETSCWHWVKESSKKYKIQINTQNTGQSTRELTEKTTIYRAAIDKKAAMLLKTFGNKSQTNVFPFLKNLDYEVLIAAQDYYRKTFEETVLDDNLVDEPIFQRYRARDLEETDKMSPFKRDKLGEKMKLVRIKPIKK